MNRNQVAIIMTVAVLICGTFLLMGGADAARYGFGKTETEATYNAEAIPSQDRIAAWLGGPDTAEHESLRSWLDERGVVGSEALWLLTAVQADFDAAIAELSIPELVAPEHGANGGSDDGS